MTIVYLSATVLILLAIFTSREINNVYQREYVTSDGYYHIQYIDEIRQNGHRLPEELDGTATGVVPTTPFFLHWLLSFIPRRFDRTIDTHFPAIADLAYALLFFLPYFVGLINSFELAIAVGICLVTPEFTRFDIAHGKSISARKPGLILTTFGIFSFTWWVTTGGLPWLIASLCAVAIVLLSSKFAIQALVFIVATLTIGGYASTLLILVLGLGLATLMSGGHLIYTLRAHVLFLKDYAEEKQYIYLEPPTNPVELLKRLSSVRSIGDFGRTILTTNEIMGVVYNPFVVAVSVVYLTAVFTEWSLPAVPHVFYVWILGGVVGFSVTLLPHMQFIGEAERYLEFAFFPSAIVLAKAVDVSAPSTIGLIVALVVFGIFVIAFNYWRYRQPSKGSGFERNENWQRMIEELNTIEPGVLVLQPSSYAEEIMYRTEHSMVHFMNPPHTPAEFENFRDIRKDHPRGITDDVAWLSENYDPDYILFNTQLYLGGLETPEKSPLRKFGEYELYEFSVDD